MERVAGELEQLRKGMGDCLVTTDVADIAELDLATSELHVFGDPGELVPSVLTEFQTHTDLSSAPDATPR